MRAIIIQGSPTLGTTHNLCQMLTDKLKVKGIKYCLVKPAEMKLQQCIGCTKCYETHECVLKDDYSWLLKNAEFDTLFVLTPIYFFGVTAQTKSALDRLCSVDMNNKKIVLITVSGSSYQEGGGYLVNAQFQEIANYYKGTELVEHCHITTNDEKLEATEEDSIFFDEVITHLESGWNK